MKKEEKQFTYTVVLVDGNSFTGEPGSEGQARKAAEEIVVNGTRNGDTYYPASQIKRVKVAETS